MFRLLTGAIGLLGAFVSLLIAATPMTVYLFEEGEDRCVRPPFFVEAAIRHCSRKIEDPDAPPAARVDAFLARAAAYAEMGQYERATADLIAAEDLDPDNAEIYLARALYEAELGNGNAALAGLARAKALLPGEPATHYTAGLVYRKLGRTDEADAALARAVGALSARLALRPRFTHLYVERAKVLAAQGRFEDALADAERAVALDPNHREALQLRLQFLERLGTDAEVDAARRTYLDGLDFPVSIRLLDSLLN